PKLIINGTNDRYWTLDSLNLFWDDLPGSKSVVYLPNAGHGLNEHRDYAVNGVGALFRHALSGRPMPRFSWKGPGDGDELRLSVSVPDGTPVRFWLARSSTRDFRESRWEESPKATTGEGSQGITTLTSAVARSDRDFLALFGDLRFEVDGLEYHLS